MKRELAATSTRVKVWTLIKFNQLKKIKMMRSLIVVLLLFFVFPAIAQRQKAQNLIIVTTDGYQWEELFRGADSAKLFGKKFISQNQAALIKKYWAETVDERRKKLMPFFWNHIA